MKLRQKGGGGGVKYEPFGFHLRCDEFHARNLGHDNFSFKKRIIRSNYKLINFIVRGSF